MRKLLTLLLSLQLLVAAPLAAAATPPSADVSLSIASEITVESADSSPAARVPCVKILGLKIGNCSSTE